MLGSQRLTQATQATHTHIHLPPPIAMAQHTGPEPREVSHASAASAAAPPAHTDAGTLGAALRQRQSRILEPLAFQESVTGWQCRTGLHLATAVGTSAAAVVGTMALSPGGLGHADDRSASENGLWGFVATVAGGIGLVVGALIPPAIEWVALRARRACVERFSGRSNEEHLRLPENLLEDIQALAERRAPLTAEGVASCIEKIKWLLEGSGRDLPSKQVAHAYVRLAQTGWPPSACRSHRGHAVEGVGLLAGQIAHLARARDLDSQTLKASLMLLAATLSAHHLSAAGANKAAKALVQACWDGTNNKPGERADRLNFLTLLRSLPGFEQVGEPGSEIGRDFDTDDLAGDIQAGHVLASWRSAPAQGGDARACIEQFLHTGNRDRRSVQEVSHDSDCLFIGLARHHPLELPQDLVHGLLEELRRRPSSAQSITNAQQRVLDLLGGTLGKGSPEYEERMEAGWQRAPFEVVLSLTQYARNFPPDHPLQELTARLNEPRRITDRLERAKLADLSVTIRQAIDFVRYLPVPPESKVRRLHGILIHLQQRQNPDSSAFLEGVVMPEELIKILSKITGKATPTDPLRERTSEHVAALGRLCQLEATPALLHATWRALNRIWGHRDAAGGDRQAQERIASRYRAQAKEMINLRILAEDSIQGLRPQYHLNLHWLRAPMADLQLDDLQVADLRIADPRVADPRVADQAQAERLRAAAPDTAITIDEGDFLRTPTAAAAAR